MTKSVIDSTRAAAETTARAEGGIVRRAARTVARPAGRFKRLGLTGALGAATVVTVALAAARANGPGSAAQRAVAAAGGVVVLALLLVRRRLAARWQVVTVAAAGTAAVIQYAASDDGWPGWTGTVLVTLALTALVAAGAATATWSASRGFWHLAAAVAFAALAAVPDQAGLHRVGVVGLAFCLLVAVARGFSKAALRVTAAVVLLAAVAALVSIGDRASAGTGGSAGPSAAAGGLSRAAAVTLLDDVATEAGSLQAELPCDREAPRPPDERLCDALAGLADRAERLERTADDAGDGAGAGDVGTAALSLNATLADLRQQVAVRLLRGDDERAARVELAEAQAERARADAERAAAAAAPAAEWPDVRALAARGMDTVVADALDPIVDDDTAAGLGPYGWIVLTLLLLLGYRRLEMANNRRYGAPIVVDRFVTAPGHEGLGPELEATMRNRVAEIALREPPPVPGAESTAKPTAAVVAALDAGSVPAAGTVRVLLARARRLVLPAPGITVEPTYTRGAAETGGHPGGLDGNGAGGDDRDGGGDGPGDGRAAGAGHAGDTSHPGHAEHVVTVRLVTTQGRRALRARSFTRPTARAAAEAAADFVVCDSLAHSRLTPSWARWRSEDGAALAPYHAVLADTGRTGPRLSLRDQIELLETARAASPGTGLVLVELGHRYDLDERPLDALRAHLTAKALHPRFTQPRYRLAMSLAMLASPGRLAEHWLAPGRDEDRRQIADLLVETGLIAQARRSRWWRLADPRCPVADGRVAAWLAQPEPTPGTQRDILKVFLLVARTELRSLERRLGYPALLAGTARQAERHVWCGLLADPDRRRTALYRYRSARWIAELRLSLLPTQPGTRKARELRARVDAMARREDVGGTALYNAACFTSVLADRSPRKSRERAEFEEQAVHRLRRVARGGMGPVPSSGWLTTDPDLVALQAVPAFNDLVRRLAHDEDRRETAGYG